MQDLFEKYPNGVIWAKLSLVEKFDLKQRFFNGDGNMSSSKEISMNCRGQIKKLGIKKTFSPTHGRKFTITIPTIHNFLHSFYGRNYYLGGIGSEKYLNTPELIVDTNNFDELLDFCNYFPHFFYRFYVDKYINSMTKIQAIRIMRNHRAIYRVLPDNLKSDKQIAQIALRSENCTLLAFAPPSILNSDLFFQLAISKYFDALYYFPENIIKKAKNRKYIESQLYKVRLKKTLSKLPEPILYEYFKCLPFIECNSYQRIGWSRSKPFSLKCLLKYCNNYVSFNSALNFGSDSLKIKFLRLKELEKLEVYKIKGENFLAIIRNICHGFYLTSAHKFFDEFDEYDEYRKLLKYFNLILNKFDLVSDLHARDDNLKSHFHRLSPFQIASFESDLDPDQRFQLREIEEFIFELGDKKLKSFRDNFYILDDVPF